MFEVDTDRVVGPVTDIDPFSPDFIRTPYRFHDELRDLGPVVWLPAYGTWCTARYNEVYSILHDWRTFCSGAGIGLLNFKKEPPWRIPSLLLENDPPDHTRFRTVMGKILSPANLRQFRAAFERQAVVTVTEALSKGRVDAVRDIAEPFVMTVFPAAVGLNAEGQERNIMAYGSMNFNSLGPRNDIFAEAVRNEQEIKEWVTTRCRRSNIDPAGLAGQVYDAADAGHFTEEEANLLVRSFFSAGVDTTVHGVCNGIELFARHPDQWDKVRSDPSRVRSAFDEVHRYEAPFQVFFRTTTREVDLSGIHLAAEQKIMLCVGAANRDPRHWQAPDRFVIDRRTTGQLTFGGGIHGCVGQMIARLEAEVLLTELAKRVRKIELVGTPERKINNTLRCFANLPVQLSA
jgi:cytochrome P450